MNLSKLYSEYHQWIIPIVYVISGLILGFIVEKIFLYNIKKMAINSRWKGGRIIINALKGIPLLWFSIAGLYFALLNSPFISPLVFSNSTLVLSIILIISATALASKLATGFTKIYTGSVLSSTTIFTNIAKICVFILGGLVLLQTVGISVTPLLTALGVGGLAVALALQDTLSNLFAGLHIIASKKLKVGDLVKLENGGEGILEDITWRNTAIRTISDVTILVPNNKMASSIVINYDIPTKQLDLYIPVGVAYNSDLAHVEKVTLDIAREIIQSRGLPDVEPFVRYNAFTDMSITFNVVIKVNEFKDQSPTRHEFIKKLHERYKTEKIEIPHRTQFDRF